MRPAPFGYQLASDLADAFQACAKGAIPLAGGQSLIAAMKLRQMTPELLVDIGNLRDLSGVSVDSGKIRIGALTRHCELVTDPILRDKVPWLCEAASLIGDVQIRNRGSLGGNICFADPRANLPPVLISLNAKALLATSDTTRTVPVESLFRDFRENSLGTGEILTGVEFDIVEGQKGSYLEIAPQLNGVPLVNIAVNSANGFGVGAGGLNQVPVRLTRVEDAIERGLRSALDAYDNETFDPVEDLQAGAKYRIKVGRVLLRRALQEVLS